MLLCDNYNGGYHLFCLKPKLTQVPTRIWYCSSCSLTTPWFLLKPCHAFPGLSLRGEIHENFISTSFCALYIYVATLLWGSVRMKFPLPKLGLGSPPGLLKLQSSIVRVKTPRIEVLFISLENYQSLNVKNGLAWAIWTSIAQVMAKRWVGSQIGNLTPDH